MIQELYFNNASGEIFMQMYFDVSLLKKIWDKQPGYVAIRSL